MALSSVEPATLTLRRGNNIKIVFKAHTFSAYDGAQLSLNAFITQSIILLGVLNKLENPPLMQNLQRKPTQEVGQRPKSGHSNSHITSFIDHPTEESSQIVSLSNEKNCNAELKTGYSFSQ